jgi:membrane protein involved in colicin uptake
MAPHRLHEGSLRLDPTESSRLVRAFAISVVLHLLCFGTYEAGKAVNLWQAIHMPAWLQKSKLLAVIPEHPAQTAVRQEVPLIYIDVSPHQAVAEAPKDAKYYSNRNSQAANAETDKETGVPKITGTQTQVAKTEDTPRADYNKLMPQFPKASKEEELEPAKAHTPTPPGDLAMAKPDTALRQDTGTAEQQRPRTIKEALMRQHRNMLVGEKMKQEGGVNRYQLDPGFDARATPFGQYDAEFIEAVQKRWFDLLDNMSFDGYRRGRVVVEFHLNYDGRITDMKVLDSNVGEVLSLLCQKAVLDPAPYDKWPREMRLMMDKDFREIKFTFFYN